MPTNSMGHGSRFGHHLRHAHAQPAIHQVLFGHHDGAGFGGGAAMASRSSGFTVCMSITRAEMPSASSVSAASSAWATSRPLAMMVTSVPSATSMALPISNFWSAVVDHRRLGTAGADEYRPHVRRGGAHQRLGGDLVGRRDHHEAGQRTGQPDFFDAHLRRAVFADRDAAVRAHHLQVDVAGRPRRRAAARSPCSSRRPRSWRRTESCRRSASPAPTATMLASAMPQEIEALRKLLGEIRGHGGLGKVRVAHHDVLVLAAQFHQRAPEGFARGRLPA